MWAFFGLLLRCSLSIWPGRKENPSQYFLFSFPSSSAPSNFLYIQFFYFIPMLPSNQKLVETSSESFLSSKKCFISHLVKSEKKKKKKGTFSSPLLYSSSTKNTPTLLSLEGANNMTAFCSLVRFPSISQVSLNLRTKSTTKRHA